MTKKLFFILLSTMICSNLIAQDINLPTQQEKLIKKMEDVEFDPSSFRYFQIGTTAVPLLNDFSIGYRKRYKALNSYDLALKCRTIPLLYFLKHESNFHVITINGAMLFHLEDNPLKYYGFDLEGGVVFNAKRLYPYPSVQFISGKEIIKNNKKSFYQYEINILSAALGVALLNEEYWPLGVLLETFSFSFSYGRSF
ncbi:MAG: hypothetical protein A3F40_02450 [Chlamydiae bacterium RIFCSPHIGHO2_12_FULL_27_8]|nr:MAG: hypothetical protein A3F40_02450 [Chlamydiae bacterium RIFCSPHIGHO2_12_FULL_27_8]